MENEILGITTRSPIWAAFLRELAALTAYVRAAPKPFADPILLTGETGVGKEWVAQLFCRVLGWRKSYAFSFATIAPSLLESELNGHTRGAFSGAAREKPGLLTGDHDAILLDEIGKASPEAQAALLRSVEQRTVRAVGAAGDTDIKAALLFAACEDLPSMVRAGRFREDLYYRINALTLRIPPLRERLEDLPLLIPALARQEGRSFPARGIDEAAEVWAQYRWPGNVRQLANAIKRCWALHGTISGEAAAAWLSSGASEAQVYLPSSVRERQAQIRAHLSASGDAAVSELAALTGVSGETIRKDLRAIGAERSNTGPMARYRLANAKANLSKFDQVGEVEKA